MSKQEDTETLKKWFSAHARAIHMAKMEYEIKHPKAPNTLYIGDIYRETAFELRGSPIMQDTGCSIFGMRVYADFRIPVDKIKVVYKDNGRD